MRAQERPLPPTYVNYSIDVDANRAPSQTLPIDTRYVILPALCA
ncbi:hypothetical protein X948_5578 [Burkholderia pseudomallei MSHR5608]|nr:hypothetical protein X948_5578 [Burkholderia pseudomallei MSHR5608]